MEARAAPAYAPVPLPDDEAVVGASRRRIKRLAGVLGLAAMAASVLAVTRAKSAAAAIGPDGELLRHGPSLLDETACASKFIKPKKPTKATEHNGVALQDVCYEGTGPHHVFIIGDWGGLKDDEKGGLKAVSHLNHRWNQSYAFIWPTDETCQFRVRDEMEKLAHKSKPAYVLNVGDNFYWGGINDHCGSEDITKMYSNGGCPKCPGGKADQFKEIFEDIYNGHNLKGLQWLGVLGNHDWGGWEFDMGWDQAIGYTWSMDKHNTGRWLTPSLYYSVKVKYPDFSVDYYFMDTNVFDALPYMDKPPHNICGPHNGAKADCSSVGGPQARASTCKKWFDDLWDEQKDWLKKIVPLSKAEWRVVVTHFPPYWGDEDWKEMAKNHELDAIITGHRHSQNMHAPGDLLAKVWHEDIHDHKMNDFLDPTAWIVSGGGGGITSEHVPDTNGNDDQYGFVDMTLTKKTLKFAMISHGGQKRREITVPHYYAHGDINEVVPVPPATDPEKEKKEAAAKLLAEKEAHATKNATKNATANHGGAHSAVAKD